VDCYHRARCEVDCFCWCPSKAVGALKLSTLARLEKALVLFMIVAWRIARLMRLGRAGPDLDAALLFSTEECRRPTSWPRRGRQKKAPTLNIVTRLIASLGGFL
jgi:hypothetical protein